MKAIHADDTKRHSVQDSKLGYPEDKDRSSISYMTINKKTHYPGRQCVIPIMEDYSID
jgi:hypothetical protein